MKPICMLEELILHIYITLRPGWLGVSGLSEIRTLQSASFVRPRCDVVVTEYLLHNLLH